MLCVQCGTDNPGGTKFCVSCNAVMPMQAPTSSASMDIAENVKYLVPDSHYQSPVLQTLAWAVHDFIEGAELEPVLEAYEAFREIFDGFKDEIPKIRDICLSQQGVLEGDMVPAQLKFLIDRAEELYAEGERLFEGWLDSLEDLEGDEQDDEQSEQGQEFEEELPDEDEFDDEEEFDEEHLDGQEFPDPQPLIDGTKKWLDCNDMICMTFDILVGREQDLKELSEDIETMIKIKDKEEREAAKADSKKADGAPESEEAPPLIPSDSTDLA